MMTKLEKFSAKQCCLICKQNHVNELVYGAVYKLGQITVHYFCLLLSTDMVQRGKDEQGILGFLPEDIQSVVKKSSKMACTVCHRGGATVKCCSCTETFHLPCGIRHGTSHQFFGHFKSFCPKHRIQQKIPKDILVGIQHLMCSICLENAELDSVIWAPCCKKNGVFHRSCLQQMAYSFGSYTLKCPLCNDRKKFVKAIENNGIYIPQQDASWEVEPNAFLELLERYQHCDAKKCICPKGRKYTNSSNKSSTNWKIVLCEDCGSQGVHFKCLAAGSHFKCDVCKHVESAALQQKIETQSLPSHAIFMQDNGSSDNSPDQNSFSHSNCAGSVNGDHRNSNDITNTPFLKTRLRNSINSSTSRSKVCIHSNLSNSVESMNVDNVNTENVTNTKDSNLEMNVDEDNQSPRNYSNTSPTLKVEVCLNKFNHNSNKTTSDTAIQESSASISREKNNTSLELNNNSNNKRSANETIQKDLSSAQKRTLIETNGHDLPVKRRRDEKVASGPESISESPGIADISHQLTVELERFHGAKKKRMIVYADNHGKYLEGKLNRIQKYNVTVQIYEGLAENCLFSLENNLHHVDVSVILCGSHDVAQNQGERYISFLKKLVFSNSDSKFVIVDLPVRYDRPHWSFINRNIEKFNKILENLFEKCDNVRMVHVSETGRKHHTIYGRHLEYYGKIWLSRRICWAANEFLQ